MKLLLGDCIEKMRELPENSVDTIICDPPYGLSFMGKKWDYDVPSAELWQEALRVLKPGGTALIFAGSRTQHRMACNVEDSGFILKDCMLWIYGSGFPKATDISKQLDKGHERKVVRTIKKLHYSGSNLDTNEGWARPSHRNPDGTAKTTMDITEPSTPEAKLWNGWKSHGLKPAYEPVLTCFKPLTIEQYFGMIIEDITEEVLCQSSNVKDVEKIFSDTQAKLKKVLGHIVAGGVRTNLWENLKYVRFVDESSMSKSAEKNKKHIKDDSAQCGVKENGKVDITKKMESHQHQRADTGEKTTLAGEAENIFARILVISTSVITKSISENTALLWKNISEDLLKNARLFTIEMATKLTIGLRTLKSSLIQTTSKNIGNLSPNYEPILVAMKPNEGSYSQNALEYGVSGLNIDGGRIKTAPDDVFGGGGLNSKGDGFIGKSKTPYEKGMGFRNDNKQGRFPANLLLSCYCDNYYLTRNNLYGIIEETIKEVLCQSKNLSSPVKNVEEEKSQKDMTSEIGKLFSAVESVDTNILEKILGKMQEDINKLDIGCSEETLMESMNISLNTFISGKNTMEQFQKDMKCTISIVKEMITVWKTYNVFRLENIEALLTKTRNGVQKQSKVKSHKDDCPIKMLDEQSGESKSVKNMRGLQHSGRHGGVADIGGNIKQGTDSLRGHSDKGGASRFFYCAKASKSERNMGCEDRDPVKVSDGRQKEADNAYQRGKTLRQNSHPTVKPIKLMEYLCILTKTPTGGCVLDPFMGSGTTGIACVNTDREFIGIEKEPEYMEIAKKRLEYAVQKRKERLF